MPRTFSKLFIALTAVLRLNGLWVYHYLDDVLLLAYSQELILQHKLLLLKMLQKFVWLINWKKSQLVPTQSIGMRFDSI